MDLNLLVALDALLAERSVSKAAKRLNLSQPAISCALARIREFFGDDILVKHGKQMFATPYAESLLPHIAECLQATDALIATSSIFEPKTSSRLFRLIASDYITAAVIVPLMQEMARIAPKIRFELQLADASATGALRAGKVDLWITPQELMTEYCPAELLLEDEHVIVGWNKNPFFNGPITRDTFFARPHVAIAIGKETSLADRHLDRMGKRRTVEVVAGSFSLVPWFLVKSGRVAVLPHRLASALVGAFPLAYRPMPFDFMKMREVMQYHPSRSMDEALTWLRQQLRLVVDGLTHKKK